MKVAKFIFHMSQAHGGKFSSDQLKQLIDRLTAFTSPQETTGGSGVAPAPILDESPEAEALVTELKNLINEIEQGESKVGLGTRIFTWIQTLFSGKGAYEAEIVKKAFSNIKPDKQSALLALAFEAASLPESSDDAQNNVQTMLKFCQEMNVDADKIMTVINTIPDPESKVKVVDLTIASDFKWDELDATVAKDLVINLACSGEHGAYCLQRLLDNGKLDLSGITISSDDAKNVGINLAQGGTYGAYCLQRLLPNLPKFTSADAKELVINLAQGSKNWAHCLAMLLPNLPKFTSADAKEVVLGLAHGGDDGADCLSRLLENGNLDNLKLKGITKPADVKATALDLLEQKPPKIDELVALLED
jgi:hypothetical protein